MAKPQYVHKMPRDPKPVLPVRALPVFRVHFEDLEAYIKLVFGFDFEYLESTGTVAGQVAEYAVSGELPSVEWQRKADQVRAGRRTRELRVILAVLAADGYIAKGQYIVSTHRRPTPIEVYTHALQQTRSVDSDLCQQVKAKFAGDPVFMQRAKVLDDVWAARMKANG